MGRRTEPLLELLAKVGVLYVLEPVFTVIFVVNMSNIWEKVMAALRAKVFRRILVQKVYDIELIEFFHSLFVLFIGSTDLRSIEVELKLKGTFFYLNCSPSIQIFLFQLFINPFEYEDSENNVVLCKNLSGIWCWGYYVFDHDGLSRSLVVLYLGKLGKFVMHSGETATCFHVNS